MFGAALLAVTLVAISLVANAAAAQPENGEARCESLHDVFGDSEAAPAIVGSAANSTADPVVDPVSPPEIALSYKGDPVEFKFGRTRDSKFDRVDVEIIASDFDIRGTEIKVEVIRPKSTKVDAAQDNSIGVKNIVVKARVDADKKSINLFVCVDPMVPTPSAPGNYKGGLVIKQPGFQRESVALDVNLQNRDKITPIIFFVGAVLAGGAFQWLVSGNLQGVSNGGTRIRGRLVTGSSVLELVFGVGAGAIAAMTTIFFSRYFNNPAWSGDFNELFLFSAAVAAAAAAAYPAAALLARGVTRQGGTTAENADKADTTKRNDDEPSGPG